MTRLSFNPRYFPLALLAVCLIAYGIMIPTLGFYWDDWPTIWYLHRLGPGGFAAVFASDRPLLGWLFALTSPLLGESTIAWQTFALLTRWLCALAFWRLAGVLWPRPARLAAIGALLLAVYPGFQQQYISVTYSQTWIILGLFFLSLEWMIRAARGAPRAGWLWAASILLSAYVLFTEEYYFGLELLRPVFLWIGLLNSPAAPDSNPRRLQLDGASLRWLAARWLPYLAVAAAFLVWRLVLHDTPRGNVRSLEQGLLPTALQLGVEALTDIFQAGFFTWLSAFDLRQGFSLGSAPAVLYAAATLAAAALSVYFLLGYRRSPAGPSAEGWAPRPAVQALVLGLAALALGGIPFWATNLPIELRFPWDRFTLAMMTGSALALAGLLELALRPLTLRLALAGILAGMAAGVQVHSTNLFRREWALQQQFFWQLAWRAPALQPGTLLVTSEMPFTYYSDNSLTAPLNWIYDAENRSAQMNYLLFAVESRLGVGLPDLKPGLPIQQAYRATRFAGSTDAAVVYTFSPPGCLRLVSAPQDAAMPQKPKYLSEMLPLSRLELAAGGLPAQLPEHLFGAEPEHGWCYYYQKAELARQAGDWPGLAALADAALGLDVRLYEVNAPELTPYIEGYARSGDFARSAQVSRQALALTPRMNRMLCALWARLEQDSPAGAFPVEGLAALRQELSCPPR